MPLLSNQELKSWNRDANWPGFGQLPTTWEENRAQKACNEIEKNPQNEVGLLHLREGRWQLPWPKSMNVHHSHRTHSSMATTQHSLQSAAYRVVLSLANRILIFSSRLVSSSSTLRYNKAWHISLTCSFHENDKVMSWK